MVGLKDLGDTAWSIEQVLNFWLQQEQEVTPDLLDLIGQAHTVFSAWIEHLKTGQGQIPDAGGMVDLADALRGGSETLLLSPWRVLPPGQQRSEVRRQRPNWLSTPALSLRLRLPPCRLNRYSCRARVFLSLPIWPRFSGKRLRLTWPPWSASSRDFKQTLPPRQRMKCTGLPTPWRASPAPSEFRRSTA
jgi:hypothetical protein